MSINYDHVDDEASKLLDRALAEYHDDLNKAKVTLHALFAASYDDEGVLVPAVKVHGLIAAAKTSITSLPDRVRGIPDAKIVIDLCSWQGMSESRKLALLDHELEHLMLQYDADGVLKRDDRNRPKLKLRKHDAEITYFHDVAQRHGEASVEAAQIRHFNQEYGEQMSMFGKTEVQNDGK